MKNIIIVLFVAFFIGCSINKKPTDYEIKRDSISLEFYYANKMFEIYDSLFYVEDSRNNIKGMESYHDSTSFYLNKMYKERLALYDLYLSTH